jgi:hypothetical protein
LALSLSLLIGNATAAARLHALQDAVRWLTTFPKIERAAGEWQSVPQAGLVVAERSGSTAILTAERAR